MPAPDIFHFELGVARDRNGEPLAYVVTDTPQVPAPPEWESWDQPGETRGHHWLVPDRLLDQMTSP